MEKLTHTPQTEAESDWLKFRRLGGDEIALELMLSLQKQQFLTELEGWAEKERKVLIIRDEDGFHWDNVGNKPRRTTSVSGRIQAFSDLLSHLQELRGNITK